MITPPHPHPLPPGEKESGGAVRLFAWQPQGHGELSFFVAARSEAEAREAVEKYIDNLGPGWRKAYEGKWGTDYYELTVLEVGQVITNDNS